MSNKTLTRDCNPRQKKRVYLRTQLCVNANHESVPITNKLLVQCAIKIFALQNKDKDSIRLLKHSEIMDFFGG